MTQPIIAGDKDAMRDVYGDMEAIIDEAAGDWIRCPECGSDNSTMIWWEKSDINFNCVDCGVGYGIR